MGKRSRSTASLKRRSPKREPYDRVLIVIEGSNTELYYFEALRDQLRLSTANIEVDPKSDSAPSSVVRYAKELYQKNQRTGDEFDRVYCVIDRDEHPTYQDAIHTVKEAKPPNVFYMTRSIPCFEYWLLLHFEFTTKPYARSGTNSPCDCVANDLRKYLPNYDKGDLKTFREKVIPLVDTAVENAKQANLAAKRNDTDNPSTEVSELVEYLQKLKR